MRIDRHMSQLNILPDHIMQELNVSIQEPYENARQLDGLEMEIDFDMLQREDLFDFKNDDLDLDCYELTNQEQLLLDFLLPGRQKKKLISSNGMPYLDFIQQSIRQYEAIQRQNMILKVNQS